MAVNRVQHGFLCDNSVSCLVVPSHMVMNNETNLQRIYTGSKDQHAISPIMLILMLTWCYHGIFQ